MTRTQSVMTVVGVAVLLGLLGGCDTASDYLPDSVSGALAPGETTQSRETTTLEGYALHRPLADATVRIRHLNTNDRLADTSTKADGSYVLSVASDSIADGYRVTVNGGEIDGRPFKQTLSATYGPDHNHEQANVTLLTTLIDHLGDTQSRNPSLEERDRAVRMLVDAGLVGENSWYRRDPPGVNLAALFDRIDQNGPHKWKRQLAAKIRGDTLGPEWNEVFPGPGESADTPTAAAESTASADTESETTPPETGSMAPSETEATTPSSQADQPAAPPPPSEEPAPADETISEGQQQPSLGASSVEGRELFTGVPYEVTLQVEDGERSGSTRWELTNHTSIATVRDGNVLTFTLPENTSPGATFTFRFRSTDDGEARSGSIQVGVLDTVRVTRETVGPNGGRLTDALRTVVVIVPEGALERTVDILLLKGKSDAGDIVYGVVTDPPGTRFKRTVTVERTEPHLAPIQTRIPGNP